MKQLFNGVCIALGFFFAGIGCVGIALPILPTTPFLLLSLFFFARGSERFCRFFMGTKLYRKYLLELKEKRPMPPGRKLRILASVTGVFAVGFFFSPPFARGILALVLALHYIYFLFFVRTKGGESGAEAEGAESLSERGGDL